MIALVTAAYIGGRGSISDSEAVIYCAVLFICVHFIRGVGFTLLSACFTNIADEQEVEDNRSVVTETLHLKEGNGPEQDKSKKKDHLDIEMEGGEKDNKN